MTANIYKYALIDLSYVLNKNVYGASIVKGDQHFLEKDVLRLTIQTLSKIIKDYGVTADKFIFIYDKWDNKLMGYYRTSMLRSFGGDYKWTRTLYNQEYLDNLKKNGATKEEILDAENKVYENKIRVSTKSIILNEFSKIGIPCLGLSGWEYDDLVWLSSCLLFEDKDKKKSVIITKDSDLTYSLTPKMDYFRLPVGGSLPQIITYDTMYSKIPKGLVDKGLTLYDYKAYIESLGSGHNDMTKTKKPRKNTDKVILEILNGNYDNVLDKNMLEKQLSTFDLNNFPNLEEAKNIILTKFDNVGHIGSLDEFKDFCKKYNVEGISDSYYENFIKNFDPSLFKE